MPKHLANLTKIKINNCKQELKHKIKGHIIEPISLDETSSLANAIKAVKYPYSVKNILVFIDKESSTLLADSSHPNLQKWGKFCKGFYENSPHKNFVVAETGIVTTGTISRTDTYGFHSETMGIINCRMASFHGHGVWELTNNLWLASPLTPFKDFDIIHYPTHSLANWLSLLSRPHPTINPSKTLLELITPPHIAALTGNVELMNHFLKLEIALDNTLNAWEITPLEMAVENEQSEIVQYLLKQNVLQHLDSVVKRFRPTKQCI